MLYWVPPLTACIAVIGGAIAYWNQKRIDQKRALVELRRQAYQRFVHSMIATTSADARNLQSRGDLFEGFQLASGQMAIVASDNVLSKLADFQLDRTKSVLSISESWNSLLQAMRKDVFEGTRVSPSTLENSFPIKFGEPKRKS